MSTASRQIWNWRDEGAGQHERRAASLRRRGVAQGLVMLAVGTLLNKGLGHAAAGRVIVALGAVQTMAALWRPALLAPVQRLLARTGVVAGRILSWLLLTPLWLLVFVPAGLWLRVTGRDPLHRGGLDGQWTAWIPRRVPSTAASARRTFLDEDPDAHAVRRPVGAVPEPASSPDGEGARP